MLFLGCVASLIRFWPQQCGMGTKDFGSTIFADDAAKSELPEFSVTSCVRTHLSKRICHCALGRSLCSRVAVSLYDSSEPLDAAPAVEGLAPEARSRKSTRSPLRTLDGTAECDERAESVDGDAVLREHGGGVRSDTQQEKDTRVSHTKLPRVADGELHPSQSCLVRGTDEAVEVANRLYIEVVGDVNQNEEARGFEVAAPSVQEDPVRMRVRKWLVVTGCAYNLVEKRCVEMVNAIVSMGQRRSPLHLNTANGQVSSDDIINVACSPFEEGGFVASVLLSTPSVISIGERCMSYGYGFH